MHVLLPGLVGGSILSLSALALVAVYRATGVLNFAQGAVGMVGTFAFLGLARGLPVPVALLAGLFLSALLSLAVALATEPLREHRLEATVLTLGALGFLQAVAQLVFGGHPVAVLHLFPTGSVGVGGAVVGVDEVISAVIAFLVSMAVLAGLQRSRYGLLAQAVASRPEVVAGVGLDERPVVLGSWLGAGVLAGVAGILLLPMEPSPSTASLTLTVIQSFAGALVGRLVSIPGAIAGGYLVGIVAAAAEAAFPVPGSGEAAVFLLMIVILVASPPRPVRSAVRAAGGLA